MLPYHLRPPVYGKKLEKLKHAAAGNDVQAGGGPIQTAIFKDLASLQTLFLEELAQPQQSSSTHHHWETGVSFGIFKRVFGFAKTALLHLLIPTSRCDREAYTQLIYAACLEGLKRAMMLSSPTSKLESAACAIFTLYTLYETNPLPKRSTIKQSSPWNILSIGLVSQENPRALHRRAFAQDIRIDRYHYSLLLQFRELALIRQAECQEQFYKHQACLMKKSGSTATTTIDNSNNLWTCSCGIARDTVEILDRLSTRLDLCEYTGPVGLEALAGHADYPYSDAKPSSRPDDSIATGATTAPRQPQHGTQQPPFQYSNDLAALMEDYHSSIHAIRLPPFKTQSRATSRLRKTLDPFFDSVAKEESWTDTRARLFQQQQQQPLQERAGTTTRNSNAQAVSNITRRPTLPSTPTPRMAAANGESHDQQPNPQTEQPEQDDPQKLSIPSYEVRLLGDIDLATSRKEHIQKAVRFLLQRGETPLVADTPANDDDDDDLMQAPSRKQPPHRADDVSSIGIGGISVASTNQYGRAALDTLLSKARVPRRVATQRSQQDKPMRKSPTTTFLSMDQGIEESGGVAEGDEDWASDVSNLSLSDDNDEDGASAATSAVGRRALETLLHKVAKGKKPASRKATRKRARPKSKEDTKTSATRRFDNADDASTVASSSTKGQGKAALDTLLNKAGAAARKRRSATTNDDEGIAKRRKQTNPAPKKKMVKTSPTETTETKTFLDKDDATAASASTVGHGRAALNSLLSTVRKRNTVQEDDDEGIAKRRKQTNPAPKKKMVKTSLTETSETKKFLDNDDATAASASTVGHGRAALNSLLSTVRKRNTAQEDEVSTNRKKAKGRAKVQERAGTTIDSIDTSRKGAFTRGTRLSVDNQNSTRRKAATVSKKPKRRHDTPESDTSGGELESSSSFFGGNESVAASINTIGAGGNALNALLSTATESHKEDADRQDTPGQHDGKSSSANESESQSRNGAASMNDGDSISAMSSTGPGRSALDALLARVGDKP